ncbi:MAG: ATP-binding protein [Candidatus Omnitrophica bacterium]|nr:ATP-binding protein [Candidatus Omnitrophota bacterium]
MQNYLDGQMDASFFICVFAFFSFVCLSLSFWYYNKMVQLKKSPVELKDSVIQLMQTEKMTALGELSAGVAHELNQPLNVSKLICQGILNDIQKGRFSQEEAKQDLPEIVNQLNKMAGIIEHMRVFSSHKENTSKVIYDVNDAIEKAFSLIGAQMRDHGIVVNKELTKGLPKILGDATGMERVILNILSNARNAVEESGKKERSIGIKTYVMDNTKKICIEITDNGLGISKDVRDKIFQPFFTTKSALAPDGKPGKGKGLGLFVASKIIQSHGGEIFLDSHVGVGSTFKILLPPGA